MAPPPPLIAPLDSVSWPKLYDVAHPSLLRFTYEDLKLFTDNFSNQNFIGRTQFCNVYRGRIPQGWFDGADEGGEIEEEKERIVTVKIWADSVYDSSYRKALCSVNFAGKFLRLKDEVALLSNHVLCNHPNLVKLMGWCCEIENENLGVVYDLNCYDTLRNLITGEILKWADRIKIALGLASRLKVFHSHQPEYMFLNISAAHIMIDQDLNPVLLEFGMLSTQVTFYDQFFPFGAYGYSDPVTHTSGWSCSSDVFAFGAILMELLSKCKVDGWKMYRPGVPLLLHVCADSLYQSFIDANGVVPSGALVEKSLMEDADFNYHDEALLSILAVQCTHISEITARPNMVEVVSKFKGLHFVENWAKMMLED